jgi:hypothetical protein
MRVASGVNPTLTRKKNSRSHYGDTPSRQSVFGLMLARTGARRSEVLAFVPVSCCKIAFLHLNCNERPAVPSGVGAAALLFSSGHSLRHSAPQRRSYRQAGLFLSGRVNRLVWHRMHSAPKRHFLDIDWSASLLHVVSAVAHHWIADGNLIDCHAAIMNQMQ